jgi:hypothetical protein
MRHRVFSLPLALLIAAVVVQGCATPAPIYAPRQAAAPLFTGGFQARGSASLSSIGPELSVAASLPYGPFGYVATGLNRIADKAGLQRGIDHEYGLGLYVPLASTPLGSRIYLEGLVGRGRGERRGRGSYACRPARQNEFCSGSFFGTAVRYDVTANAAWRFAQVNLSAHDGDRRAAFVLRLTDADFSSVAASTDSVTVPPKLSATYLEPIVVMRLPLTKHLAWEGSVGLSAPLGRVEWEWTRSMLFSASFGLVVEL